MKEQPTQDRPINTTVWAKWFKIDPVDDDVERMIVAASQWALSVEHQDRPRWLSLLGNSGVGKSLSKQRTIVSKLLIYSKFFWQSDTAD